MFWAALLGYSLAFADVPTPGEISGRWKLVSAECSAGSVPDSNAVPVGAQGSVEITAFGDGDLRSLVWSRFVKDGSCWSSAASLLLLAENDEGARISYSLPGYLYMFNDIIQYKGFRVGLRCGQFSEGKDPLFRLSNQFYRREGDGPAEFRWLVFNSRACVPRQDLVLTFKRVLE